MRCCKLNCPTCGNEPFDEPCEHTVYVAANECGLIYVADRYRAHFFAEAERLLREKGELEDGEAITMEYFPCEIIPDLVDRLEIKNLDCREEYSTPPSGLVLYAGFVDAV